MDNKDEDILDSALEDFEDAEETKEEVKEKSLREVIEEAGRAGPIPGAGDFLQDDFMKNLPGDFMNGIPADFNLGELENMMNQLANEIQSNPQMQSELENIGSQFMKENIVQESMEEIKGKLTAYLNEHRNSLSNEDRTRHEQQLEIYSRICDEFRNNNEGQAMELISSLSQYGDLPNEIMPPMNEECRLF